MDCRHLSFAASVDVNRLEDAIAGSVEGTGFVADVTIRCAQCGTAFRFVGLPAGFDVAHPMVSVDATTLHAPIEPATEPQLATRSVFRVPAPLSQH